MIPPRQFLQTASDSRNSVRELLQTIFAAELLRPSRCLWIISPWLRDVPVLDNTTGSFLSLCPDFPIAEVRLSLVLDELITRGTQIVIATRPDMGNRQVFDGLRTTGFENGLVFHERVELHAKGVVGDSCALIGSMNFTYNGLERLTEMLSYQTDRAAVEQVRLSFRNEYGGRA
jgi:phosphatidylserine/phosphatidylglycerophosphate/cardiolipin synthase-like enzyme